ncbi:MULTISPECIES: hypothetical protein [Burkholderia]|uniref:Uncharacterized protein n=1 Tax=Burkholderia sola TaxID=2843302 RepID=A0ABV2CAT3_9BURK|nr:hypothetical protein [Burkholderia sp. CpTa8-5]MBP0608274.1 hypothetical protein [Burkholderia sp. CpTa8-5]
MTSAISWREVLFDLHCVGLPPRAVFREIQGAISLSMLRSYGRGTAEPSHVRGELILDLWCEKTGKRREDAPRRPLRRP